MRFPYPSAIIRAHWFTHYRSSYYLNSIRIIYDPFVIISIRYSIVRPFMRFSVPRSNNTDPLLPSISDLIIVWSMPDLIHYLIYLYSLCKFVLSSIHYSILDAVFRIPKLNTSPLIKTFFGLIISDSCVISSMRYLIPVLSDPYVIWSMRYLIHALSDLYVIQSICYPIYSLSNLFVIWSICYLIHSLFDPFVFWSICYLIHLLSDPFVIWSIRYPIHLLSDLFVIWSTRYPIHLLSDPCVIWSIRYLIHSLSDPIVIRSMRYLIHILSDPYGCTSAEGFKSCVD